MRVIRILASLCLAIVGLLMAVPASAHPLVVQPQQMDLNGPGALTVIAQVNSATGPRLLTGMVFTISRIDGIDPLTEQGRAQVELYQRTPSLAAEHLTDTLTLSPTDSQGRTTVAGLPVAAYLIHQQGPATPMSEPLGASERVQDFVVAMPTQDPDGADVYALAVTPKPTVVLPPTQPSTSPSPSPSACVTPSATTTARAAVVTCPTDGSTVLPPVPGASSSDGATGSNGAVAGPQSGLQINAGDGANFNVADQMALIGLGLAVLIVALLATRRRRQEAGVEGSGDGALVATSGQIGEKSQV